MKNISYVFSVLFILFSTIIKKVFLLQYVVLGRTKWHGTFCFRHINKLNLSEDCIKKTSTFSSSSYQYDVVKARNSIEKLVLSMTCFQTSGSGKSKVSFKLVREIEKQIFFPSNFKHTLLSHMMYIPRSEKECKKNGKG